MTAPFHSNSTVLLFFPTFGQGGVEKMQCHLANGLTEQGVSVVFMTRENASASLQNLSDQVTLLQFEEGNRDYWAERLDTYLNQHQVALVISGKFRDDQILSQISTRHPHTRFMARIGMALSIRNQQRYRNPFSRWYYRYKTQKTYRKLDGFIANSQAVAEELAEFAKVPLTQINILPNPTITPELATLSQQAPEPAYDWQDQRPVILAIGRLAKAKGFDTLLKAFALLNQTQSCRLVILGSGNKRQALIELADQLGISTSVFLPGYVKNPYAWLQRCSLFVLSSRWEGCPNVLIEALATGTPVVSTACTGAIQEILQQSRYGSMVPIGDVNALALAMEKTLQNPHPPEFLKEAALPYYQQQSCQNYIQALNLV
jgi:glycosyltransferase involved in cell wall biosynthesis